MTTIIKHEALKTLAVNGGVKSVTIIGEADGFALNVSTLSGDKMLHTKTGQPRFFKKLETVLDYLKDDMGIARAAIQFERWNPRQATLK
jgi:hypothetical protein